MNPRGVCLHGVDIPPEVLERDTCDGSFPSSRSSIRGLVARHAGTAAVEAVQELHSDRSAEQPLLLHPICCCALLSSSTTVLAKCISILSLSRPFCMWAASEGLSSILQNSCRSLSGVCASSGKEWPITSSMPHLSCESLTCPTLHTPNFTQMEELPASLPSSARVSFNVLHRRHASSS